MWNLMERTQADGKSLNTRASKRRRAFIEGKKCFFKFEEHALGDGISYVFNKVLHEKEIMMCGEDGCEDLFCLK